MIQNGGEFDGAEWDNNCPYLHMSEEEVDKLPNLNEDGTVSFYDLGKGYLVGKSGLERFRKHYKNVMKSK